MSYHVGASGVTDSSRVEDHISEDASEENSNKTHTQRLNAVTERLRDEDPVGERGSCSVEQLQRPSLSGRKANKKTCSEDNRGRWSEGNHDKEEEALNAEQGVEKERGKPRQRQTERTETHREGVKERQGIGSVEMHSNNTLEGGGGSNLQKGQMCLRSESNVSTTTYGLHPQSPWPVVSTMCSTPPTIRNKSALLASRTSSGELDQYSLSSTREPDPFWQEVRTGARIGRPLQRHHSQTPIPAAISSELGEAEEEEEDVEDGEEGGSGMTEMMSHTMTSAAVPPCVLLGERKISKRERKRIKCLRRRQRKREKWRQSQLQGSRQVNSLIITSEINGNMSFLIAIWIRMIK